LQNGFTSHQVVGGYCTLDKIWPFLVDAINK
jgi:hypothetical protein